VSSLYKPLGGDAGIEDLVDALYRRVTLDDRLAPFFEHVDMAVQRRKFRAFLHTVSGGPQSRAGIELRSAHSRAVDEGLEESHFDAFADHFRSALDESGVPQHIVDELVARIADTRDDVLGR